MPAPLLLGLFALGVLAVSCQREEEPPPHKSDPPDSGIPPCDGTSHTLLFGGDKVSLCHESRVRDGFFQPSSDQLRLQYGSAQVSYQNIYEWKKIQAKFGFPEMAGLSLGLWKTDHDWVFSSPERWSLEAESLLSNAMDFCRERALDLQEVGRLASRIQPTPGHLELSPKEKAYAFMVTAILFSVRQTGTPGFYGDHHDFIDTAIKKIEEGRLRLVDLSRDGHKGDIFNRALYSLPDNTLQISEASLDLRSIKDRSTLVHELYHFFQDSQRQKVSLVEGEVQAYLAEAEYTLSEEKLFGKDPEDLEHFIATEINGPKTDTHHPVPTALRAVFYRFRGERKLSETWLEKCRDDAEVTKTLGGFFDILKGPVGPGHPGSVTSRFLKENASQLKEPGAEKIWTTAIDSLKKTKAQEIAHLKVLSASPPPDETILLRQYFKVLRASLDVMLMERLRILRSGHSGEGTPGEVTKDSRQDKYLTKAAEELARLRINRRLFFPMDGVE